MKPLRLLRITRLGVIGLLFLHLPLNSFAAPLFNAKDPGVRLGPPDAGNPLSDLTLSQLAFFVAGKMAFDSEEGVAQGLGPRMNLDSCVGCHSYPASGGASPFVNPQIAFAKKNGAVNVVPSFLSLDGPVREVRFIKMRYWGLGPGSGTLHLWMLCSPASRRGLGFYPIPASLR